MTTRMSKINYLTPEGHARLTAELKEMKTTGRQDAAAAIAEARDKGDLSENAEYDAAKDAQGMLEARINDLEKTLANARVLNKSELNTDKVTVLSTVRLVNQKTKKEIKYQLVSSSEASFKERKISVDSPIGAGLLGKRVGEVAEIQTPGGLMKLEVWGASQTELTFATKRSAP